MQKSIASSDDPSVSDIEVADPPWLAWYAQQV